MSDDTRTYIVTGAAGGIGGAAAARLCRAGANVVAVDVSARRLEATVRAAEGLSGKVLALRADVSDEDEARRVVSECIDVFGEVHGLANVAGGMVGFTEGDFDMALSNMSLQYFRDTFRLNVETAFLMCRAVEPELSCRSYGKIVNVASLAAFANRRELGNAAYNPAKAAVVGLTQTLSLLLGRNGIRVNAVAPGLVQSPAVVATLGDAYVARHLADTALGRLATVADEAETIAFLMEPASDAITGEVVRVSAGVR
ncbi:MAG: 7-alpha-hydroxysteroid dehydrogenase [Actinomycetota bacterium]|nr:7-alpha-hydroxysteroid dehydrogenase [Actinomycetota bacterium]